MQGLFLVISDSPSNEIYLVGQSGDDDSFKSSI